MKRSSVLGIAALVAFVVIGAIAVGGRVAADGSALSRGARGWLAARQYLEARGCAVTLLDRPLETMPPPGVLVLALPWQRLDPGDSLLGLHHHLARGGTVLLALSGERLGFGEDRLLAALGLGSRTVRGKPPLHPLRWREYVSAEWRLVPNASAGSFVRISAPHRVAQAGPAAQVLFRGEDGVPAVFAEDRGRGRVVVVPADAFSNARLSETGNADLLETLRVWLGDSWTFDEYHHGLSSPERGAAAHPGRAMDAYLAHVALAYVLALLALARRFGPAWSEPPVVSGSAASLLVGLGALHDRLGHHASAERLLVERARELDPRLRLPAGAERGARADGPGLVRLARAVGRAQSRTGRTE